MKTIIALAGSNSSTSVNKQLLDWTTSQITSVEKQQVSLVDLELPMFSEDLEKAEGHPQAAKDMRAKISAADAFIIASPEHNGMMPAALKNLFDWLSRVSVEGEKGIFNNKPVLLLSSSPGPRGGMTNLENMSKVMPFWGADIKGSYSLGRFYQEFEEGEPTAEHREKLLELLNQFEQELV